MKRQPTGWDMISDHYTFNRELIPRLQRTQKKKTLCNKKTNTPVENTAMELDGETSEEVTNGK